MCGIAGIVSSEPRLHGRDLASMCSAMEHRGPDGHGYVALSPGAAGQAQLCQEPIEQAAQVFLGHRRLSIIDLGGSQQPLCNEDRTVWVTFNGEIYNFESLRDELKSKGHVFREAGDTEVLVHLWEEYREAMPEKLVGMFAFAIYDTRRAELFIARDRYGQKPLYYIRSRDLFAFASELQGLWPLPDFPAANTDPVAVAQYLKYGYIPSPKTIHQGVFALPAGMCATLRGSEMRTRTYWRPRVKGEEAEDSQALEALLDESVRMRMRSDVPLGAFLSGGIDSGLIVASMAKQATQPVQTFTISTGQNWSDESEAAALSASHLGADHHVFEVSPDLVSVAERLARHYGQPYADYSSVPTYYVCRETRKHVTVALSGDGGDELFAGYMRYRNAGWTRAFGYLPPIARRSAALFGEQLSKHVPQLAGRAYGDFIASAGSIRDKGENLTNLYHRGWRRRGFENDFLDVFADLDEQETDRFATLYDEAESDDPIERWLEVDQQMYLRDDILSKVDIASMAVSLECRAPLLDHRLGEMANRMRRDDKICRGETKRALRRIARRNLPAVLLTLPKKGFTLPLAQWLRSDLQEWAYETIFTSSAPWRGYVTERAARRLWDEHQAGGVQHEQRLWCLVAWCLWETSRAQALPSSGQG